MEDEPQTICDRGIDRCDFGIKGDQNAYTGTGEWKDAEGRRKIIADKRDAAANGKYSTSFLLPGRIPYYWSESISGTLYYGLSEEHDKNIDTDEHLSSVHRRLSKISTGKMPGNSIFPDR